MTITPEQIAECDRLEQAYNTERKKYHKMRSTDGFELERQGERMDDARDDWHTFLIDIGRRCIEHARGAK